MSATDGQKTATQTYTSPRRKQSKARQQLRVFNGGIFFLAMNAKKAKKLRKIAANLVGGTMSQLKLREVYQDIKQMHKSGEVKA